MTKTNTVEAKWLYIVGVIALIFLGLAGYFTINAAKTRPVEQLYEDYEDLELSYEKAVAELEAVSNNDYGSIDILKKNLQGILDKIKEEKKMIDERRKEGNYGLDGMDTSQAGAYEQMLEMSKQVADVMLVERLAQIERQNKELQLQNDALNNRNVELETNLEEMQDFIEDEKIQNVRLNEALKQVNDQLSLLESTGDSASDEIIKLRTAKEEYERRLVSSNQTIVSQNQQIQGFVKTLRKVSSNCYFVYEEGNPDKEVKIYLTANGISKQYLNYFLDKKPHVYIAFSMNDALFEEGVEKVDLSIFNNKDSKIFNTSKTISSGQLTVQVGGNLFTQGDYYIELMHGDENLLIGDEYNFLIGNEL